MTRPSALLVAAAMLALTTQVACVAKGAEPACTVEGAEYAPGGLTQEQICRDFSARLAPALADRSHDGKAAGVTFAIRFAKQGSISATASGSGADNVPPVAIDVMDRALNTSDLERLADAMATAMIDASGR